MIPFSYTLIEFDDYSGEWLIPLLIASENSEDTPLIVCRSTTTSRISGEWAEKTNIGYTPLTERLQYVTTLCDGQYDVFKVTDLDAYHLLWSRFQAVFVFSADCHLHQLEKNLAKQTHFEYESIKDLASWGYAQQYYGPGDYERYAYFYTNNPNNILRFKELLAGQNFAKWFENLHCLEAFVDDYHQVDEVTDFLKMKIKHHNEQKCYVLYRNFHYSLANIKTLEDFKQWCHNHGEHYDNAYDENNDYRETLESANNIRAYLSPLLSLPTSLDFEYNNHSFKLICIDDFEMLEIIFGLDESTDYIDGFFSMDTDIEQLQKHITEHGNYRPERLLYLGQWAVIRQADDVDGHRFIISARNKMDLAKQISKNKKEYIENEENTRPNLK